MWSCAEQFCMCSPRKCVAMHTIGWGRIHFADLWASLISSGSDFPWAEMGFSKAERMWTTGSHLNGSFCTGTTWTKQHDKLTQASQSSSKDDLLSYLWTDSEVSSLLETVSHLLKRYFYKSNLTPRKKQQNIYKKKKFNMFSSKFRSLK